MFGWGYGSGQEGHRGEGPFSPPGIKGTSYQHGFAVDADLEPLTGEVFLSFSSTKLLRFLPAPVHTIFLWKEVTLHGPHFRYAPFPSGRSVYPY